MDTPPPIPDPYLPRDKHEFAAALIWRLEQLGISQAELARRLDTRSETVTGWVRAHHMPTTKRLVDGVVRETGIAAPADRSAASRARASLEQRVAALEAAVSELRAAQLGARDGGSRGRAAERHARLHDEIEVAAGEGKQPRQGQGRRLRSGQPESP